MTGLNDGIPVSCPGSILSVDTHRTGDAVFLQDKGGHIVVFDCPDTWLVDLGANGIDQLVEELQYSVFVVEGVEGSDLFPGWGAPTVILC